MKAQCRSDFSFFDDKGQQIPNAHLCPDVVFKVQITWRVQKNRRSGQQILWVRDNNCAVLCPVRTALCIYDHSLQLNLKPSEPMGAYQEKGRVRFITNNRVSKLFQESLPDILKKELSQYSAQCQPQFYSRFPTRVETLSDRTFAWESEAYQDYLGDTDIMAHKHVEATGESNFDVFAYGISAENLLPPLLPMTPQLSVAEFGKYI